MTTDGPLLTTLATVDEPSDFFLNPEFDTNLGASPVGGCMAKWL